MNLTGINFNDVKQSNQTAVLYLLNREGKLSRKDIADRLGLTPAAVTKICRELLNKGKIIEVGGSEESVKSGRKKVLISVNSESFFVIGISLEPEICTYGIYTVSGEAVLTGECEFEREKPAEQFLLEISEKVKELIKKSKTPKKAIIGAGVGLVGSVNSDGITVGKYGMWQEGVKVRELFEKALDIPVIAENNVKAFAIAQTVFAKNTEQNENSLFIKWGPGVGSAITINSEVFSSNANADAEIGHYIITPGGEQCRCGRKGCLEAYASSYSVLKSIRKIYSKENTPLLYELTRGNTDNINYSIILKNLGRLDKEVEDLIDSRIKLTALSTVNAATLLDPDSVILFGYMFNKKTTERFIEYCKSYYPKYDGDFIKISSLSEKSKYIGPVALALKNMFFEK